MFGDSNDDDERVQIEIAAAAIAAGDEAFIAEDFASMNPRDVYGLTSEILDHHNLIADGEIDEEIRIWVDGAWHQPDPPMDEPRMREEDPEPESGGTPEACACDHAPDEHGRDLEYPGSTACEIGGCDCIAYERAA